MFILIYLALCLLVAYLGKNRGLSFLPVFLLSLVLTPLIGLIFLLVARGVQVQPALVNAGGTPPVVCNVCADHQAQTEARVHCSHCGRLLSQ